MAQGWVQHLAVEQWLGLGLLAALAAPSCRLVRKQELLESQQLVARLDSTTAEQVHLEEEYQREFAHVQSLQHEVELLTEEEERLAAELMAGAARVGASQQELAALTQQESGLAQAAAARRAQLDAGRAELVEVRTSGDRARIAARLAELRVEVEALQAALAALPSEAQSGASAEGAPPPAGGEHKDG